MFQKILVAIQDDSSISQHVFSEALSLAKATDAQLLLLHIFSPFDQEVYPIVDSVYPTLHTEALQSYLQRWKEFERKGLEMLRSSVKEATDAGVVAEMSQNAGDPSRTICDIARTWDVDLIMMGRRGFSGLGEFVLGSVSNYVLHHAPCSVLVVQGKTEPDTKKEQDAIAAAN